MFDLITTAAMAAQPAATAAVVPAAAATAMVPVHSVSPAEVAAYIDPRDVAQYLPAPPPTTELVEIGSQFFRLLENVTMVALLVVGFFLLARLIHACFTELLKQEGDAFPLVANTVQL